MTEKISDRFNWSMRTSKLPELGGTAFPEEESCK